MKLKLEDLVTSVATELMAVTTATLQDASTDLLHRLVDYFEVDLSFLRRNDHDLGAVRYKQQDDLLGVWGLASVTGKPDAAARLIESS